MATGNVCTVYLTSHTHSNTSTLVFRVNGQIDCSLFMQAGGFELPLVVFGGISLVLTLVLLATVRPKGKYQCQITITAMNCSFSHAPNLCSETKFCSL